MGKECASGFPNSYTIYFAKQIPLERRYILYNICLSVPSYESLKCTHTNVILSHISSSVILYVTFGYCLLVRLSKGKYTNQPRNMSVLFIQKAIVLNECSMAV